jgi:hypothetical protein
MAEAIATVGMVEGMVATTPRIIMDLRGMRRRATWCASASHAARETIMGIGDMAADTVMGKGTATGIGTNVNL